MINSGLWLLLIALALFLGWYLGYQAKRHKSGKLFRFRRDYIVGLNYLLNEESDKAVDLFIKVLDIDSDTVETHLALGSLFRRRGELDRAIRIHHNLVSQSDLDNHQRVQALLELGQDYLSAGVLDRAEQVFKEVIDLDDEPSKSLISLLDIYEQEKNWYPAIHVAKQLELVSGKRMHKVIAHYYCELANIEYASDHLSAALKLLKQSLLIDAMCARANLMRGQVECKQEKYKTALKTFKRIESQNPKILPEALPFMINCYLVLDAKESLLVYLRQLLVRYPQLPIILILADCLQKWQDDKETLVFLANYIRQYPSFQGLKILIGLHAKAVDADTQNAFKVLYHVVSTLVSEQGSYRCCRCGFLSTAILWRCPSCKSWETIEVDDVLSC